MGNPTHDEILGKKDSRLVQPRTVPFGYQIEQWERHQEAFEKAQADNPQLDEKSFQVGWNAAFCVVYPGRKQKPNVAIIKTLPLG